MHSKSEKPEEQNLPYATDDVDIPMLGKGAIALIIFFVVNLALALGAYYVFVVRETATSSDVFKWTPKPPDPNVPILQKDPQAEIHKFRADEYDAEHSYAHWKDGDGKESLRIPISRAMEIVKQHGLPRAIKSGAPVATATSHDSFQTGAEGVSGDTTGNAQSNKPAPIAPAASNGSTNPTENSESVHLPDNSGGPPPTRP